MRQPDVTMRALLRTGDVLMHSMVLGELACGNLPNREAQIAEWRGLPRIGELSGDAVVAKIEERELMGRGIGIADAHLVCSVLESEGARLWTRDRRLHQIATESGIAFAEGDG